MTKNSNVFTITRIYKKIGNFYTYIEKLLSGTVENLQKYNLQQLSSKTTQYKIIQLI